MEFMQLIFVVNENAGVYFQLRKHQINTSSPVSAYAVNRISELLYYTVGIEESLKNGSLACLQYVTCR